MSSLYGGDISREWQYITTDTYEQVTAPGYFNDTWTEFRADDVIRCTVEVNGIKYFYRFIVLTSGFKDVVIDDFPDEGINEAVSNLQGGGGVTPGTSVFTITVPDDSLQFFIDPINATYTAYQIVTDDDTEPLWNANTWTTGRVPSQSGSTEVPDLQTWTTAEAKYLWILNGTTVTGVSPAAADDSGSGGIDIRANDTLGPVWTAAGFACTDSGVYTITAPVDAGIGIDTLDTYRITANGNDLTLTSTTATNGSLSLATGDYAVQCFAKDLAGNESGSNIVNISIGSTATINTFTVGNGVDTKTVTVTAYTVSDVDFTDWIYTVDDTQEPSTNDAGWGTAPTPSITTLDLSTYALGIHTIRAYARDPADPLNITAAKETTTTLSTTAGNDTISLPAAFISYSDESATETITLNSVNTTATERTVTVTASPSTTRGNPAAANVNYKPLSTVVTFPASDTSATFSLEKLFADLGFNSAYLDLTLSDEVNCVLGTDTMEVEIRGSYGYKDLATGEIDIFNPPTNLTPSGLITATNGQTISGYDITATGNYCIDASNTSNVTIENCILSQAGLDAILATGSTGLTTRNCYAHDLNTSNSNNNGYLVYGYASPQDSVLQTPEVLGCRIEDAAGVMRFGYCRDIAGLKLKNNYTKNLRRVGSQGNVFIFDFCKDMVSPDIQMNRCLHTDPTIKNGDYMNFFKSGCTSGGRGEIKFNYLNGTSWNPNAASGGGILVGDKAGEGDGYISTTYNITVKSGSFGCSIGGGRNHTTKFNWTLVPSTYAGVPRFNYPDGSTSVGGYVWRVIGSVAGTMYNTEYAQNKSLYYTQDPLTDPPKLNDFWWPPQGDDGQVPNNGPTPGGAEEAVTGWSTNKQMTAWESGAGEDLFENGLLTYNQPAIGDGVVVLLAKLSSTKGDGVLTYNRTAETMTWQQYGDSSGTAVAVDTSSPQDATLPDDRSYWLTSGNGVDQLLIVIDDDVTLKTLSGVKTWTVKVTPFTLSSQIAMYPGSTGEWPGETAGTPTDTDPPTVPVNVSAVGASSTTITLDCDDSTDAAGSVAGYNWYRDDVYIATTAVSTYLDTVAEGATHEYKVNAFDDATPANTSGFSEPFSGTASAPSNEVANGELDDITSWTEVTSTTTFATGVATLTNTGGTATIKQTVTGLSATTLYDVKIAHQNNSVKGHYSIEDGATFVWAGGLANGTLDDSTMTETAFQITTVGTSLTIGLSVNTATEGQGTDFDYIRITAV